MKRNQGKTLSNEHPLSCTFGTHPEPPLQVGAGAVLSPASTAGLGAKDELSWEGMCWKAGKAEQTWPQVRD